jgi:hypothetical protein
MQSVRSLRKLWRNTLLQLEGRRIYIMKMEAAGSYETVVNFYEAARCHNTEDSDMNHN